VAAISAKFNLTASNLSSEEGKIVEYFQTKIRAITKTLEMRVEAKPKQLKAYIKIWMKLVSFLSIKEYKSNYHDSPFRKHQIEGPSASA